MVFGKHIKRYYIRYGFWLLLGILALWVVDYCQLLIPNIYQMVLNGMDHGVVMIDGSMVAFDGDFMVNGICMPMIKIILCIVVGRFLWRVAFFSAAIRVETDLRERMFVRSSFLSQSYYQVNKVGDLMSLYTNDLDTVQECFGWGCMQFFDALLLGWLALSHMWRMDHVLTVLSMIPMVFLFASASLVGHYMTKKWEYRQACFSRLSDFAQESFSGIAVIKAFVKESKELMSFDKLNRENEEANVDFTRMSVLMRILVTSFVESVTCVILGYGGYLAYKGVFNAGQLMEFIGYFTAIVWPIMAVSELIDMTSRGKASMNRIGDLLDAPVEVTDREGAKPIQVLKGDQEEIQGQIVMRDLSFTYPGASQPSLKHISFTINAGEKIGLAGKTGCGKTTLVELLLRIYNVEDGTLFLDGVDVNDCTIDSVRGACAYVPQDNFLFSDTIQANIAFAKDGASKEAVAHAAQLADIHDNIMGFTQGYDTVLGERGITVSGGQKQRISIARALMKEAPVLILDDSVSAVDTKTETTILNNIRTTRAGRTTILIAHRISTIEQMDRIFYMEDGALLACGRHQELYNTVPAYRRMVDLQRLEEEGGRL